MKEDLNPDEKCDPNAVESSIRTEEPEKSDASNLHNKVEEHKEMINEVFQ